MDIQYYRLVNKIIFSFVLSFILLFSMFCLVALAQESSPFEISITPVDGFAVSGQTFTYTVKVTNIGADPVQHPIIDIEIPEGTKFVETRHTNKKWFGGNQLADSNITIEQITLYSIEPIAALEVFSFALIVEIPDIAGQEVIIDNYQIVAPEQTAVPVTGPTIKTKILTPTPIPTWTPTPSPSPSPPPLTATPSPSSTPQAVIKNSETPVSPTTTVIETPEPLPTITNFASSSERSNNTSLLNGFSLIGILLLGGIVVLIGIGWLVRKK